MAESPIGMNNFIQGSRDNSIRTYEDTRVCGNNSRRLLWHNFCFTTQTNIFFRFFYLLLLPVTGKLALSLLQSIDAYFECSKEVNKKRDKYLCMSLLSLPFCTFLSIQGHVNVSLLAGGMPRYMPLSFVVYPGFTAAI